MKNLILRFWHIYTFWDLLNSLMLFLQLCMYVCVCVCVCVWVNTITSKWCIRLYLNLICIITGHHRTNPVDFGDCRMYSFFFRSKQKNYYTLWPIESNTLKYSNIRSCIRLSSNLVCILSVIVLYILPILVNFGIIVFSTAVQKRILMHYNLWCFQLSSLMCSL